MRRTGEIIMAENKKNASAARRSKKVKDAALATENVSSASVTNENNEQLTIEQKLKVAEGNINRANSDAKARENELREKRENKNNEAKEQAKEAKRQQKEYEKQAQLLAEQKIAALEYAENYRRKLVKDKEKAMSRAQRRKQEEEAAKQAAELKQKREKQAEEITRFIEKEREEARARSERATALLNRVTKCARVDDDGSLTFVDRREAQTKASAPVESPASTPVESPASTPESAPAVSPAPEKANAKKNARSEKLAEARRNALTEDERRDAVLNLDENGDPIAKKPTPEELTGGDSFFVSADEANELSEIIEEKAPEEPVNMTVDVKDDTYADDEWDEEIYKVSEPAPTKAVAPAKEQGTLKESTPEPEKESVPAPALKKKPAIKITAPAPMEEEASKPVPTPVVKKNEKTPPVKITIPEPTLDDDEPEEIEQTLREEISEPEENLKEGYPKVYKRQAEITVLEDDIVKIVKADGKEVENKKQLKKYLKRSDKVVKSLGKNIDKAVKDLDKKVDENDAPATVVEIIGWSEKILEIRCDNLSVCARVGVKKYIEKYRDELHREINSYNGKVISYASLTGEQLTRVSPFLPDHLIEGTGAPVIPVLSYRESYLELYLDDNGETETENDNVTTTIVSPDVTAAELLGNALIETHGAAVEFGKKTRRADKEFLSQIEDLKKQIEKNQNKHARIVAKETEATEEFRAKATKLEDKTPPSKRTTNKYKKRLAKITKKYSRIINKIKSEREALATERKNTKLLVECLALERERLVVASSALRGAVADERSEKVVLKAKRNLVSVMLDYNRMAAKCSEATSLELTRIAGGTVDDIAHGEKSVIYPKIAYRRELTETVGEEMRVIGDRLKTPVAEEFDAEDAQKIADVFADAAGADMNQNLESLLIKDLREKSEAVHSKWALKKYFKHAKKVRKKLDSTVKQIERAIARAFDKHDVTFSIVECIRVRAKLVELGSLNIALANKMRVAKRVRKESKLLAQNISLYNERVVDFSTLTGEQFNRISALIPEEITRRNCEILVPSITYRESYIEVYPKDASVDMFFVKPEKKSATDYIPIAFKNRRLTENKSVEITIINSPHITEEYLYGPPATKVIHHWFSEGMSDLIEIRLKSALKKVKKCIKENEKLDREFELKLAKLNKSLDKKMFKLESVNSAGDKPSEDYKQKLVLANKKFSRELMKLKLRRAAAAIERKRVRLTAEQFVIEREFLVVSCRKLFILRSYGWRGVLKDAKREVIERIDRYNTVAKQFSNMLGEPIAQASTAIADEIIKYGKTVVFPYVAVCKELIETLAGKPRVIGEKYRGSMRMGVDLKGNPIMQSLPTDVPHMSTRIASPSIGVDSYGEPVIGATYSGLVYLGGDVSPELNAQFIEEGQEQTAPAAETEDAAKDRIVTPYDVVKTGVPLVGMPANVSGEFYNSPQSSQIENSNLKFGFNTGKIFPINPLANEIEEYALGAIKAQSRTITNIKQWRRHIFRSWLARKRLTAAIKRSKKQRLKLPTSKGNSGLTNLEQSNNATRNFYLLQEMVAQGMIVEIRSANLYAIAKLGIWWRVNYRTQKLKNDIEKYNQYISAVSGADEFDLTAVSLLLADRLASKTGTELVPRIHIKESFLEVYSTDMQDATPILPTVSADKILEDITVNDRESFLYYYGRASSVINKIDNQTAKYSKVLKKKIKKLRWFRRRKVRATARYNKSVFELSCDINNTAKYQKKLRKIKWRYSKLLYKITRRETMPLNTLRLLFFWKKRYPMCSYIGLDDVIDFARLRDFRERLADTKAKQLEELAADMTKREAKDAKFINTLTKFSLNAERNRHLVERKYARRRERDELSRKLAIENATSGKERWYRFGHWFLFLLGKRDEAFIGRRDPNGAPLENTPERNVLTRAALEREKVVVSARIYAKLTSAIKLLETQIADYENTAAPDRALRAQYSQDREDLKALRKLLPKVTSEFSAVVSRYNVHLAETSFTLQIPINQIDNSFIKNIEATGIVPELGRLAWRGEIIEIIGEEERSAGIRRVI